MTSTLDDIIRAYLTNQPNNRVLVEGLLRHVTTADPTLVGHPTARSQLAPPLSRLAAAGAPVLPKARSGWDHRTRPPLPPWIGKPATHHPVRATPVRRVWPQSLEAAAAIATRPDEYELL